MEKTARSFKGAVTHAKRVAKVFAQKNPHIVGAALGGAGTGALSGAAQYAQNKMTEAYGTPGQKAVLKKHPVATSPWLQAGIGAAIGGTAGFAIGHDVKRMRDFSRAARKSRRGGWGAAPPKPKSNKVPEWAKGAKTKAEAKKAYRAQAQKHHPDRGGSTSKMQEVNAEWDDFQNSHHFDKLGFVIPSFFDEFCSIMESR